MSITATPPPSSTKATQIWTDVSAPVSGNTVDNVAGGSVDTGGSVLAATDVAGDVVAVVVVVVAVPAAVKS